MSCFQIFKLQFKICYTELRCIYFIKLPCMNLMCHQHWHHEYFQMTAKCFFQRRKNSVQRNVQHPLKSRLGTYPFWRLFFEHVLFKTDCPSRVYWLHNSSFCSSFVESTENVQAALHIHGSTLVNITEYRLKKIFGKNKNPHLY